MPQCHLQAEDYTGVGKRQLPSSVDSYIYTVCIYKFSLSSSVHSFPINMANFKHIYCALSVIANETCIKDNSKKNKWPTLDNNIMNMATMCGHTV